MAGFPSASLLTYTYRTHFVISHTVFNILAEDVGFEPTRPFGQLCFRNRYITKLCQSSITGDALNHSANPSCLLDNQGCRIRTYGLPLRSLTLWWPQQDSNLHVFRQPGLSQSRLPFRHRAILPVPSAHKNILMARRDRLQCYSVFKESHAPKGIWRKVRDSNSWMLLTHRSFSRRLP